jgi:hypothetical protein
MPTVITYVTCSICQGPIMPIGTWRLGHNAAPIIEGGRCCTECNDQFVIPIRIRRMKQQRHNNFVSGLEQGRKPGDVP